MATDVSIASLGWNHEAESCHRSHEVYGVMVEIFVTWGSGRQEMREDLSH